MNSLSQATDKLLQHSRNEHQKPANQSAIKRCSYHLKKKICLFWCYLQVFKKTVNILNKYTLLVRHCDFFKGFQS